MCKTLKGSITLCIVYKCIEKAKNDLLNVQTWVDQLESLEYNPITIFKVQGEQQSEETGNLASNDFLVLLTTN